AELPTNDDGDALPPPKSISQLLGTAAPPSLFVTFTKMVIVGDPGGGVGPGVGLGVTFGVGVGFAVGRGVAPGARVGVGGAAVGASEATGLASSDGTTTTPFVDVGLLLALAAGAVGVAEAMATWLLGGSVALEVSGPSGSRNDTATRPTMTRPINSSESRAILRSGRRPAGARRIGRSIGGRGGVPPPRTSTRRSTSSSESTGTSSKPFGWSGAFGPDLGGRGGRRRPVTRQPHRGRAGAGRRPRRRSRG